MRKQQHDTEIFIKSLRKSAQLNPVSEPIIRKFYVHICPLCHMLKFPSSFKQKRHSSTQNSLCLTYNQNNRSIVGQTMRDLDVAELLLGVIPRLAIHILLLLYWSNWLGLEITTRSHRLDRFARSRRCPRRFRRCASKKTIKNFDSSVLDEQYTNSDCLKYRKCMWSGGRWISLLSFGIFVLKIEH